MKIVKEHYGILIGLVIIFSFLIYLLFDLQKTREYHQKISFLEENAKVTLETNYLVAKKTFSKLQDLNISSVETYLKKQSLSSYLFNSSKYILSKGEHKIGIENPFNTGEFMDYFLLTEDALCMDLSNETLIVVVSDTIKESMAILEEIKDLSIEEGKELLKNTNISVFWYQENKEEKLDFRNVCSS